jgi:Fic family protein
MPHDPDAVPRSYYVTSTLSGERVRAFIPSPLPPNPRTLDLASLQAILAEANQAVGRLDGTTSTLPDLKLFLYSYVRKEAVLSSQIEGTQSSLSDLLLYENAEADRSSNLVGLNDLKQRHFQAPFGECVGVGLWWESPP